MTRKHFQAIAYALSHIENPENREEVVLLISSVFTRMNEQFDVGLFLKEANVNIGQDLLEEFVNVIRS